MMKSYISLVWITLVLGLCGSSSSLAGGLGTVGLPDSGPNDELLYKNFREQIYQSLNQRLYGMGGWTTLRYGKAAFPFVVDRLARETAPIARAAVKSYQASAKGILQGAIQSGELFSEVMKGLGVEVLPANPILRREFDEMAFSSIEGSHYSNSGTVFITRWGSGDSDGRSGQVPASGSSTASSFSGSVTHLFRNQESVLREFLRRSFDPTQSPGGVKVGSEGYFIEYSTPQLAVVTAIPGFGTLHVKPERATQLKELNSTQFFVELKELPAELKAKLGQKLKIDFQGHYGPFEITIEKFLSQDKVLVLGQDSRRYIKDLSNILPGYYCDRELNRK